MARRIGFSDIALRCGAAILLVVMTWNPSGLSYVHWILEGFETNLPPKVLGGVVLLILYVIFMRATLRSIGLPGVAMILALIAALMWTLTYYGVVDLTLADGSVIAWLSLIACGLTLGIGLSWSIVRRVLSGQADVDDVDA
ncbi:MAG: DUF6524 family protein [Pseudomonadota bacterium]